MGGLFEKRPRALSSSPEESGVRIIEPDLVIDPGGRRPAVSNPSIDIPSFFEPFASGRRVEMNQFSGTYRR
jgi:hypothetical protein